MVIIRNDYQTYRLLKGKVGDQSKVGPEDLKDKPMSLEVSREEQGKHYMTLACARLMVAEFTLRSMAIGFEHCEQKLLHARQRDGLVIEIDKLRNGVHTTREKL